MGRFLMHPQHLAYLIHRRDLADVAESQGANLDTFGCQIVSVSDTIHSDRTQAVYASDRGRWGVWSPAPTSQEYRSRGCLRAHGLFSHFAWWHSLPLAPRKKKKLSMLTRRFRPSRSTRANTSDLTGRVIGAKPRLAPRYAFLWWDGV